MRQMSRIISVLAVAALLVAACGDESSSTGGIALDESTAEVAEEPSTGIAVDDDVDTGDLRVLVSNQTPPRNKERLQVLVNTMTLDGFEVIRINTIWDRFGDLTAFEVWYTGGPEPDVLLEQIDELR